MIDVTLRQLEMFCTTARLGSFTQAAEALDVGQPAVSQHVAALERVLGIALVARAGRGVLFTAPRHRLARQRAVTLEEAVTSGLIAREPGSATRATAERALRAAGVAPRYAMELGSNEAVKRAVLAGLGVGLLSRYALEV